MTNKEILFQAVSDVNLVQLSNCLGSEEFWD